MALVASSPEIICATLSLEATRLARSPAKRWLKKVMGRVTVCQKKREVAISESLASMRAIQLCCSQVSTPCRTAVVASPIASGQTRLSLRGISTSSTNILESVATASPGTTSINVTSTTKKSGMRVWPSLANRLRRTLGGEPLRRNPGPGWKARQTPVKPSSNSCIEIRRGPPPGSLM